MKPIKLEIEGLNSFESKQTLDFTKLGDGVFGIFGKTGSGKSTILDAIILALYGDIERSRQNIDFINTKRKKAVVSLEFEILMAGEQKTFLVTRTFQIKKNGKDVDSSASLYEISGEDKKLLVEGTSKVNEKIYSIILLGKNEFIKCIALPQGEFSAFLKAKQSERTEIMSNIFDLTKYGERLCARVKEKVTEFDREIAGHSASLSLVEYANDETLENARKEFLENTSLYETESKTLKEKSELYSSLSKSLENKNKLEKLTEKFAELEAESSKMEELGFVITKNQNANMIKSDYEKRKKVENDVNELSKKVSSLNENRLKTESEQNDANVDFDEFKKTYDEKQDCLRLKLVKIDELMKLEASEINLEREQNQIKSQIDEKNKALGVEKSKLESTESKIVEIENDVKNIDKYIEENKPDVKLSYALEQTKNIESELILIDDFYKMVEKLYDQANSELKFAQEEYNTYISQEKKLTEKIDQIQNSIETAFEFEDMDKTNFNKIRSCDKQIDGMKAVKTKVEMLDVQIEVLSSDKDNRVGAIESLNEQIIQEQNKLTEIEKDIDEKEKILSQKRDEREELLGGNFFSLVSNRLRIGDTCPICNNKVIQKNYEEVFDIGPISGEIKTDGDEIKKLRFERDKIFAGLVTLKSRCEFEKAQIEIDKSEIERLATSKLVLYREFVDSPGQAKETFEKLYNLLNETTENLETLIDLQDTIRDEQLKVIISKTQAGTKVSIYTSEIESLTDLMYNLQTKKAEREFAIYNVNEVYKNLKEYKKQIAEGKNIELIIDQKKEEKYKLKDELNKQIILKANLEQKIGLINSDIQVLKVKLDGFETDYKKVKQSIITNGIPEGVTVLQEQNNTLAEINKLKNEYSKKETRLESCKELLSRTQNEYEINVSLLSEKKKEAVELDTKISNMMIECEFKSNEELEKYFEQSSELKTKQQKFNEFNSEYKLIKTQKSELEKDYYGDVNEEKVNRLKDEVRVLNEKVAGLSEKVGRTSAEFERIEADNKKRKTISDELAVLKHKFDLAKELSNVLKGKALAEYVAEEYLQEITTLANQKLNLLLDGKYVLRFENKDFFVEDNFNDGKLRPADTLSGGETFLVSLSLALAISDSISLLSSRNMEFFFLDEGFGTLDPELCEVVVSALHKLESQNLKIGLISHVTELEESIKNKVYVTKTQFGSKISIEHTL